MLKEIYLDNSSCGQVSETLLSDLQKNHTSYFGSALSPHQRGQRLQAVLNDQYKKIYQLLCLEQEDTFLFTSSGSESVSQVISSVYKDVTFFTGKNQFATLATDEAAPILSIEELSRFSVVRKTIEVDKNGQTSVEKIAAAVNPRTALISLSWVNGLTGSVQPVAQIAQFCQEKNILLHVDASHYLGKFSLNFKNLPIDFISFNGSQINAPNGLGGLIIRKSLKLSPLVLGSQEQAGFRAGAVDIAGAICLTNALSDAIDNVNYLGTETSRLRRQFEKNLAPAGIESPFKTTLRAPHITALLFPGIFNEALLYLLNKHKVFATIGGGSFQKLSQILTYCQYSPKIASSALSFSLSRFTTEEEIDRATEIIIEQYQKLKLYTPADIL